MLDWLGSVQIRKRTGSRVELDLTRATAWTGWALSAAGGYLCTLGRWATLGGVVVLGLGILLATLRRRLVFDRDEGLLRSEQRIFGIRRRTAIPLFHLRAVVVAARRGIYVAYVERRLGGTIHLDEARRCSRSPRRSRRSPSYAWCSMRRRASQRPTDRAADAARFD